MHTASSQPDNAKRPVDLVLAALGDGGQRRLAKACGVTPQAVNQWVKKGRIPSEHVLAAEGESGISRHVIRPDVFGEPPEQAAA